MTGHTTSLTEWAQMVSGSIGLYASLSVPYFLLVDMEVWRWPRPLVAAVDRVLGTVPGARLVVAASNAPQAARDFYRDAAALALLLTTSPKGAMA